MTAVSCMCGSAASGAEDSVADSALSPGAVVTAARRTRGYGMKEIIWTVAALLPFLTGVIGDAKGTNQNTTVASASPSPPPPPPPRLQYVRNFTFKLGSDVNLTCGNQTWNETLFIIWTINLTTQQQPCKIAFETGGNIEDTCRDGKSLRNTSSGQSYLHIPDFSNKDVGIYNCDSAYKGGNNAYNIDVNIIVPPSLSAWLETGGGQTVAVCRAERGKPAATISWSQTGPTRDTSLEHDGFVTVESRLELLQGSDLENLTCVINHTYWAQQQFRLPQLKKGIPWISVVSVVSAIVLLGGILFYVQTKLYVRYCRQPECSQSKSAPTEEVEEVEPYASYVQRVNSLYNSSAGLFA